MALRYGFFNSVNGDRKYNAEDMTKYFDKIVSDGVFHDGENALKVTALEGMTIQIQPGRGLISCRWLENDGPYNITLTPSHVILDRVDRIVMRLNLNENGRNMELAVIQGTPYDPSSTPIIPPLSADPLITELTLAYVTVVHGESEITAANINDSRADSGLCGWVTSLIANSGGVLRKYQNYRVLTEATTSFSPGIAQYRAGSILQIYIGGILLIEGVEYTISGSGSTAVVSLTNEIRAGNNITCILLTTESTSEDA